MSYPKFEDNFRKKKVDVRPLDQREKKMNNRKGFLPVATEKKPVCAIVQMELYGNPYEQLKESVNKVLIENEEFIPDSLKPDYVKKYLKP